MTLKRGQGQQHSGGNEFPAAEFLSDQQAKRICALCARPAGLTPTACRGDAMMANWAGPQQQRMQVST